MKWQWSIESPFGPIIKWPNLHYPGIGEMAHLFLVTWPNDRKETMRMEGLRAVIRDLKEGEHVEIERLENATLR